MSIMTGIDSGDLEEVKKSIKNNKKNLKVISKRENKSPLECAIMSDEVEIVEYMIDFMSENGMSYLHNRQGGQVMMTAIRPLKMAKLLKSYGFSIEDKAGGSVIVGLLGSFYLNNPEEIYQFLIDNGADVNKYSDNKYNWSPLMQAASSNMPSIIDLLVKAGADIDVTDHNGRNILDIVEQYSTIETIIKHSPKLTENNLDKLSNRYSDLLAKHPKIHEYIDELISMGRLDSLPQEITDIFLF